MPEHPTAPQSLHTPGCQIPAVRESASHSPPQGRGPSAKEESSTTATPSSPILLPFLKGGLLFKKNEKLKAKF